jgi:hypothetical protein
MQVTPYIVDRHTRERFWCDDEAAAIRDEEQELRKRIHALKLRKRALEQMKDALDAETEESAP